MSKLIGAVIALLLVPSVSPDRERFAKYKAVEAYEVPPGLLVLPTYSADGQVCEIGLERLHYSPELIRLDSTLSREEIDQIFDKLVPADERGPQSKDLAGSLITQGGGSLTTTVDFQNVSIQIYGAAVSKKHSITVDEVAATLKWKKRKCQ
ncbi:MAG TPA: hypothetical protein VMB02_17865 [Candidatus Aquilonibacter sp.]|nr:hypothetical protein [Candidatus Aquilonibacter sp.]